MQKLSFEKNPRHGQQAVIDLAIEPGRSRLCCQLPTGYGKTFTACCVYSVKKALGLVDRLLYIVPTVSQLDQFCQDGKGDLSDAAAGGNLYVCDIAYSGAAVAISNHRKGTHEVFACTIQSLGSRATGATVKELLSSGRWMIVIDEYHHYGIEKTWGRSVLDLERMPGCKFLLAMSATPYRPENDSAFGEPEVVVTYRQAVREKAVKRLTCHAYTYQIDAIEDGEVVSYVTQDLVDAAGGDDSPEALERVFKEMRWSPKYISPLVDIPLTRMMRDRISSGYRLQAIIGAFCCSHAQLVCEQVQAMFPELTVDWVGTGKSGRADKENEEIIKRFCPPKRDGKRRQEDIKLDVLVHVGKAGEGLDTVFVSEVIHLNPANKNNSNDQENGRAARFLPGVVGTINVETGSDYSRDYLGDRIMSAFDSHSDDEDDLLPDDETPQDPTLQDIQPLPDEPKIEIIDCRCIEINKGEVERMALGIRQITGLSLDDPRLQAKAEQFYLDYKRKEAELFNDRSVVVQWQSAVDGALNTVTRRALQALLSPGVRADKSFVGDIKRRINARKKRSLGSIEKDVNMLKAHYNWLKNLETELINGEKPSWLL
jgi:hypothetical protein